ncbi:MAG: homocysteine S-methyltransferase family protein [Candidatus Eisenbacteria sp.]|nr:homocysteine S-methyltransferase family protein [Candidatus Eisenbacteria bacterium]
MDNLLVRLSRGEILVGDGAMGTMLMEHGLAAGGCPEAFNLERPEVLEQIAQAYHAAGADIVETNTFGGSPLKLAQYGLADRTEEINHNAIAAVRRAVGEDAYVSASCGPTGCTLKPYGDTDPDEIAAAFRRQLTAIVEAGVDLICVETMTDLVEARLAVEAAKRIAPDLAVAATMTFDATPRGFFTIMGVTVAQAVEGLTAAGADVLGSNCGNGIEGMVAIAREFRAHTERPLIIQSNAGLPRMEGDHLVYPETPEFMAARAKELIAARVGIIGGCCGTTPEHIRALRGIVDAHRSRANT